jgi:hypothetical protein
MQSVSSMTVMTAMPMLGHYIYYVSPVESS